LLPKLCTTRESHGWQSRKLLGSITLHPPHQRVSWLLPSFTRGVSTRQGLRHKEERAFSLSLSLSLLFSESYLYPELGIVATHKARHSIHGGKKHKAITSRARGKKGQQGTRMHPPPAAVVAAPPAAAGGGGGGGGAAAVNAAGRPPGYKWRPVRSWGALTWVQVGIAATAAAFALFASTLRPTDFPYVPLTTLPPLSSFSFLATTIPTGYWLLSRTCRCRPSA
jgi:hypothetical protein